MSLRSVEGVARTPGRHGYGRPVGLLGGPAGLGHISGARGRYRGHPRLIDSTVSAVWSIARCVPSLNVRVDDRLVPRMRSPAATLA